jgi:hypothetical protein
MLSGCDRLDDSPGVYHIIEIPEFNLTTSIDEGTNSHAINEVWVYSTTDVLGVFPLPASIPYLNDDGSGMIELTISAGIKANGIAATRKPYSFYEAMSIETEFIAGDTSEYVYNSEYIENANIILCENFESSNKFQASSISVADIVRTTDEEWVFEGAGSGLILLTDSLFHMTSTTQEQLYDLPTTSGPIWLEYNYKSDNSFAVGLEVIGGLHAQRTPIIIHNPTNGEWKKMYLDLLPLVSSSPGSFGYEITLDATLDLEKESGYVAVDNFKIIHY